MDRPKTTPKDFFLWAGAMLALYVSVFSFIALLFDYINYAYPDPLTSLPEPYSGSMTFEMASLIVLFPLALYLMHVIRQDIGKTPEKKDLWVRRWALVFTIFIAGATVAIDLIVLIQNFLGGDLTAPFILEILLVFLVIGGCFLHFLAELWGYWDVERRKANSVAAAAGIALLCALISGFIIMGAPWSVRLYRFDDQKVSDLMQIQSDIGYYYQQEQKLPSSLADINNSLSGYTAPTDEQTNQPYSYSVTGATSFELCADFNAETQWNSQSNASSMPMIPAPAEIGGVSSTENNDWYHGSGKVCFERTIDPAEYPPMIKN